MPQKLVEFSPTAIVRSLARPSINQTLLIELVSHLDFYSLPIQLHGGHASLQAAAAALQAAKHHTAPGPLAGHVNAAPAAAPPQQAIRHIVPIGSGPQGGGGG